MLTRPDPHDIVARHPGPVNAGDTLEVPEENVAVVVKDGTLLRVLSPGTYTVPPEFGGPGVELYFVTSQPKYGEKFGGPVGMAGVRTAFGDFRWRVVDPERAVVAFMGAGGAPIHKYVALQVIQGLKGALTSGVPAASGQIAEHTMRRANEALDQSGIHVDEIGAFNLSS